jgi:DNA-binding MarR family transcriptional regulator
MDDMVDRSKRTKVHSDERILLFLSEFSNKRELWDVPKEVTQKGISAKLDILENNVSRSLKRLQADDLVEAELKHIKGEKRRQRAYFLTPKGEETVVEVKDRVSRMTMTITLEGELLRTSIDAAFKRSKEFGLNLTMAEVYQIKRNGEEPFVISARGSSAGEGPNLYGHYQLPDHFYGREKESAIVKDFLNSKTGVLLIWGIAGMGKTSLILHSLTSNNVNGGYICCEPWTDRIELISEISSVISEMGLQDESEELQGEDISPGRLTRTMRELSATQKNMVLVIDDLQKTGGGIDIYIEALSKAAMDHPGLKLVLLTRDRPQFLDPRYELRGTLVSLELKGLDEPAIKQMVREQKVEADPDILLDITKGHPLFIELLMTALDSGPSDRFHEFLDLEVISPLSPRQKRALEIASIVGMPFHRSLLRNIKLEDIDILKRKGLLREDRYGLLSVHDLIADHLMEKIPSERREDDIHEVLGYQISVILRVWGDGPQLGATPVLKDELKPPIGIENHMVGTYLSIAYEDNPGLRGLLRRYIESISKRLLDIGKPELARNLLMLLSDSSLKGRGKILTVPIMGLERSHLSEEDRLLLILNRAKLHALEGEWQKASGALDLIEASFPKGILKGEVKNRFNQLRGQVSRSRKRFIETIENHRAAIIELGREGDRIGVAREKLELAQSLYNMGEFQESAQEALESASCFEEEHDPEGEVNASIQAFRSYTSGGRRMRGRKSIERAREIARSMDDQRLLAIIELESILNQENLPMENHIASFGRQTELLPTEDTDIAVRGYLRIAKQFDGAPGKEYLLLRLKCLSHADNLLNGTPEREGLSTLVKRMGPNDLSERVLLESRIDLLEQALSFLEPENRLKNGLMEIARERGYPFLKLMNEDIKGTLLSEICDSQWQLFEVTLDDLENEEVDPEDLEMLAEDQCHNLLMAGNHLQLMGRFRKARETYHKCREVMDLYEKAVIRHSDHVTEWDIRKVKEVMQLNLSQLG